MSQKINTFSIFRTWQQWDLINFITTTLNCAIKNIILGGFSRSCLSPRLFFFSVRKLRPLKCVFSKPPKWFGSTSWVYKPKLYSYCIASTPAIEATFCVWQIRSYVGSGSEGTELYCVGSIYDVKMFCYEEHWSIYRNGFLSAEEVCWDRLALVCWWTQCNYCYTSSLWRYAARTFLQIYCKSKMIKI